MARTIRRSYFGVFAMLAAMALLLVLAGISWATAGDTVRVSVDSSGNQADEGPQGSYETSISADGRFVAFSSYASDLVEDDTNGKSDIFVRDLQTGTTKRVSVDSDRAEAEGTSLNPSISDDGRYVAFISNAPNLVQDDTDTNNDYDVFVHDRDADEDGVFDEVNEPNEPKAVSTKRVSVDSSGNQANGRSFSRTSISANGRFVAFSSTATNLLPGGDSPDEDVFVRDRDADEDKVFDEDNQAGAVSTQRVSTGNGDNFGPSISADGRYVAFTSNSSKLVGGDTNNAYDTFVRNRLTGAIQRVNVDSSENQAKGGCDDFFCPDRSVVSISSNGRYVTFSSSASNLAANDTNGLDDVFVRDVQMGTTQRVSVNSSGIGANALSRGPSISDDGRYIAFLSTSSNLVEDDTNGVYDIFVHDRDTDADGVFDEGGAVSTQRVSVNSSGTQANGGSYSASISANGLYVAFSSGATNLVENDTNNTSDSFVHEVRAPTQQPSDNIAPTTTARSGTGGGASYTSGTSTNQDVEVSLRSQDNEVGSGAKKLTSSATDAQPSTSDTMLEATSAALEFAVQAEKVPAGDGPRSAISADFNGDGKADLATSNYYSDDISVLLRDGDGTFQAAQNLTVGDGPSSVTSADIDGDGKVDLAVANQLSQNISVLSGNGDGTFQAAKNSPATVSLLDFGTSGSLTSADFNEDGKADLATSNYSSDNVSVLLSDGTGFFEAAKRFPAGYGPHSITSADLNGDSKADLAVANQHSDNISVLLGNGDGIFEPAQNFLAADSLRSVTSADFNGDSKADLAVAHSSNFSYFWRPNYPEGLSVLLGNGDGSFQAAEYYAVGSDPAWRLPRYVTTADFNRDKKEDLAIANNGSWSAPSSVSVLQGRADGTFQFDQELSADVRPTSLAAANLNADNFPDLAVATEGSSDENPDSISVLLNMPGPTKVTIDSGPPQLTNSTTASFAFSSDESDATIECRLDDGPFESCNSPKEYTGLSEGYHTFEVRAFGAAGPDLNGSAYWDWTVDTTAPAAPVISSPPEGGRVGDSFTVSGTAEADSTVQLWEGATSKGTATASSMGTWSIVLSGITEGSHTYKAKATDKAGNASAESNPRTVTVDVPPETNIISGLSDYVKSTSASFSFSSSEAASTFQCSLDGSTFASCTSPKSYSKLRQGNHTFRVRAIDKAGNADASPASLSWFVDTVVPKGTISINGGNASTPSRSVTLELSASDPSPASGVDSMRFRNGGTTTWSEWFDYSSSAPWTLTAGAGTKTVYVQYKDRAGNNSTTASDTIRFSP